VSAAVHFDRVRMQARKTRRNVWTKSIASEELAGDPPGIGNRGCEPQQPSNIVVLSMGGARAISKASFGRTARFGTFAFSPGCIGKLSLSSKNKERRA
jgi:hypothetical protein